MKRLALALALFAGAAAADDRPDLYSARPLDFSLQFSHHNVNLDYSGLEVDSELDRITFAWRERFGERLQLGLAGGYAWVTQRNNPATAGRELDGYHAGFLLDLDLFRGERVDAFVNAAWLYQKVEDDDGSQKVALTSREPSARLGARLALSENGRVYAGWRYGRIDGEQRLSGTLDETRTVKQTREAGGFAGLRLRVERDGYIGIAVESGSDRSVALYFGRHF